jgi:expansin
LPQAIALCAAIGIALAACDRDGGGPSGFGPCDDPVPHSGRATYYDFADGTGACGFDATTDPLIGAMNQLDYDGSAACGACANITAGGAAITIRVVDLCPECPEGAIDLHPGAFAEFAPLDQGVVDISWVYAPCAVAGPIVYHFKDGSSQWWTAVQIRNNRNAIASVEYRDADGAWRGIGRVDYDYFVADQGLGVGPYAFRVTDVYGNALVDEGIPLVEDGDVDGAAQFPECE